MDPADVRIDQHGRHAWWTAGSARRRV